MAYLNSRIQLLPRSIRPVPDPLGLYLRVGRNDHREMLDLVPEGKLGCFGLVFEATALKRHRELRERALSTRLDAILDPRTQPAAMAGGHSDEIAALPWAASRPQTPDDFAGTRKRTIVSRIAEWVLEGGFTQVLAPTHVLQSGSDEWFEVDLASTRLLRERLDEANGKSVQILYSLAIPYATLRDPAERRALIKALQDVPLDAVWLRVDGLGARSTSNGIRNYIEAAREFEGLAVPIVADGMGGLAGLSLLAFGAVGGIAHGVTFGERVDNGNWRRPRTRSGFGNSRRVYVAELDLMLDPTDAETLLRSPRARALFACHDTDCCRLGSRDMLDTPARHFLLRRARQVAALSNLHQPLRMQRFLEDQLRPATDALVQATRLRLEDASLQKILREQRKRLEVLRVDLAAFERQSQVAPHAEVPKTRIAREPRVNSELRT
jgi:hypothetical protein